MAGVSWLNMKLLQMLAVLACTPFLRAGIGENYKEFEKREGTATESHLGKFTAMVYIHKMNGMTVDVTVLEGTIMMEKYSPLDAAKAKEIMSRQMNGKFKLTGEDNGAIEWETTTG